MTQSSKNFQQILEEVQKTRKPIKTYPSVATQYLGVARRGGRVVQEINKLLDRYEVICEPNFASAWFYGEIEIKPKQKISAGREEQNEDATDPTPRLGNLDAANLVKLKESGIGMGLISVTRESTIQEATTLMLIHKFSQLPIINNLRDVVGVISWRSIGQALALGKTCITVNDCKDSITVLDYEEPLFNAVKFILEEEVVLVRQKDKTICGIVTTTDIGEKFISMAEPFLFIEQIENHLRKLLDKKFTVEELNNFSTEPQEKVKEIKSLLDMTFGQYLRLLEDPSKFKKLNLKVDRGLLVKQLEQVRKIRNDVMHFNPDAISPQSLELLRQTVHFFHTLTTTLRE